MKLARPLALGIGLLLAGSAVAAGVRLGRSRPVASGPVLVVRVGGDASLPVQRADGEDRAMALAAAAMSSADRRRVLELVDYTTARLEARLSPLGTDFDEGDPVAQLRASLAPFVPSFTASRELERGTWRSSELSVRAAASCADAQLGPGEQCLPLSEDPAGPPGVGAHARFLAWAASHAAIVELGTAERAQRCAAALRSGATQPSSAIALVLLDDDFALRPSPDRDALRAAASRLGRAMAANGIHDTKDLEAFAKAPIAERVAPWLVLSKSQVVVIPRLSALAQKLPIGSQAECRTAQP